MELNHWLCIAGLHKWDMFLSVGRITVWKIKYIVKWLSFLFKKITAYSSLWYVCTVRMWIEIPRQFTRITRILDLLILKQYLHFIMLKTGKVDNIFWECKLSIDKTARFFHHTSHIYFLFHLRKTSFFGCYQNRKGTG